MSNAREDGLYRRINHLTAVQIAGLAMVVLVVAVVAILQGSELRRARRSIDDLERRIVALESGSPIRNETPPPGATSGVLETGRSGGPKRDDPPSRPMSGLSHQVMSLAAGLCGFLYLVSITAIVSPVSAFPSTKSI